MRLTGFQKLNFTRINIFIIEKTILLFFFIFDVALQGVSTKFSSRKVAFFGFVVWFLYEYFIKKNRKKIFINRGTRNLYFLEVAVTIFSAVHVYIRGNVNGVINEAGRAYPYPIYFIIFALLAPVIIFYCFKDEQEFLKCFGIVGVMQSIFIWCEYGIEPLKIWLSKNIYVTGVQYTEHKRATGLGMSGAALTVMLAFCVFALGMLVLEQEKIFRYWLQIGFIISAQFLTGRTGLYISILNVGVIFLLLIVRKKDFIKNILYAAGSSLLIFIAATVWLSSFSVPTTRVEATMKRSTVKRALSKEEGGFYHTFTNMEFEVTSDDRILGTGSYSGEIQKNSSRLKSDSGYVKRAWGDGIIFAVIEYTMLAICLLVLLGKSRNKWKMFYYFWMIAVLFVTEIKEPFIYYYLFVTVIFLILFYNQENCLERGVWKFKIGEKTICI